MDTLSRISAWVVRNLLHSTLFHNNFCTILEASSLPGPMPDQEYDVTPAICLAVIPVDAVTTIDFFIEPFFLRNQ